MGGSPSMSSLLVILAAALLGAVSATWYQEETVSCPDVTGTPKDYFYWKEDCEEKCQGKECMKCTCEAYCAQEYSMEDQQVCSINCNNPKSQYTASRAKYSTTGCLGKLILTEKKSNPPKKILPGRYEGRRISGRHRLQLWRRRNRNNHHHHHHHHHHHNRHTNNT